MAFVSLATLITLVCTAVVRVGAQSGSATQTSTSAIASAVSTAPCSPLELVVARGTIEPGTLGVIVGDPLLNSTQQVEPGTTGYSVPYPANTQSDSVEKGVQLTLAHMNAQPKACPDQKFVMVGYSQGAEVMHQALAQLDTGLYDKIVALVMFGDPGHRGANSTNSVTGGNNTLGFPERLANKLKENCEPGDPVCTNTGTDITKHLVYGEPQHGYMNASADYIQRQVDSNGNAGPEPSPTPAGVGDNSCALASLGVLLGQQGSNSSCNSTSASMSGSAMPSGSGGGSGNGSSASATANSTQGASSSAATSSETPAATQSSSAASSALSSGVMGLLLAGLLTML